MKHALAAAAIVTFGLVSSASAQETPAPVARWFDALRTADRDAFAALIATDAKIDLRDLGIVQTRDEFIESLDSWEEAMEGATIEAKPVETTAGSAVMDVCYRFPGNAQRNRESYSFDGGAITAVTQETVGDSCEGF